MPVARLADGHGVWGFLVSVVVFLVAGCSSTSDGTGGADVVDVFAAASLTDAIGAIAEAFTASTGTRVRVNMASSSALARQIEQGAGCDVFVSANTDWMDYLEAEALIRPGSRRDVISGSLVVIRPVRGNADPRTTAESTPEGTLDLTRLFASADRIALADPTQVPVGKYARASLTTLGLWADVSSRLVLGTDARATTAYVALGEADLGVVYATEAVGRHDVVVVTALPDSSHPPILYPAAACVNTGAGADAFLAFLTSRAMVPTWRRFGFEPIASAP